MYRHRNSVLPLQWKITHSSRWKTQLLASELSLIAFILLLVMVFSKKWLYISACRFYQQWPTHLRNKIYTSAHIMSMGLLQICTSKNCLISENGKVALVFSTLILFPINVWIFELKRNLSVPIGWSYFIGWMVFILYVICAFLCYFSNKNFCSLMLNCSSDTMSCSSSMRSGSLSEPVGSDISVK
ncbi:outer dense fiber protein 4 [Molossus molossus]|uniref:outer dense fiber protein 4 n=1 Tax=Molossus molossus TaxID=27622 RepID=UPI001747054C|nr:outer dense fiber protein 4 [Molossus molossus]